MFDSNGREKIPIEGVFPLRLNQTATVTDSIPNDEGWESENWKTEL